MKRVKVETIYHVADSDDEGIFADKLKEHATHFLCPNRSRNASRPHYESCIVSVERKKWEEVS